MLSICMKSPLHYFSILDNKYCKKFSSTVIENIKLITITFIFRN